MCDTIQKSGGDSAVIRIHNKDKAIAISVDSSANYCKVNQNLEENKLFVKIGEI